MKKLLSFFIAFCISCSVWAQSEFKVMSYNIRLDVKSDGENQWDKRKEKVATLINYNSPDFVGLQEVLHHQFEYLNANLKNYKSIGVGRDDGKDKGERSAIYYREDKYKLLAQSTFWLSPTPDSISKGWDAAIVRVCTYGLFQDKKTKKKFYVFNTHFDHIGKQARLESAKLIVEKIKSINKNNYPFYLTGDFNSLPDEAPAQYLASHFTDCYEAAPLKFGGPDTWNAFKFLEKPKGRIDFVFTNRKENLVKFLTLTDSYDMKYPSDHFPVMATFKANK